MKQKIKRLLSVMITLCMLFTMVPNTIVPVKAAGETYDLELALPWGSNDLLPNSTREADVKLNVTYPDGHTEPADKTTYTVQVEDIQKSNPSDPDPSQLMNLQIINGNRLVIDANSDGIVGSSNITLAAYLGTDKVATMTQTINIKNEIYQIPHKLQDANGNVVNPDIGETLDLESLLVLKKLTYDHANGKSVTVTNIDLNQSQYVVDIQYNAAKWEKTNINDTTGVYNLNRITLDNAEFIVSIIETNVGCLAEHHYEFESLGCTVKWSQGNPGSVSKTGTADFHLDVNMPGKDYDVEFVFGYGPRSQGNLLTHPNNNSFYSLYTFPNGKISGIQVDGQAVAEARQGGDFWIKVIGYVVVGNVRYVAYEEYTSDINLVDPSNPGNPSGMPYTAEFPNNHYGVFNYENSMEMYLDTSNVYNENYNIEFAIGAYNPVDGFVSFNVNQNDLFDPIIDANNKTVGICLNGAAIASICDNSQFEVQVKLTIPSINYTWNYCKTVSLNRTFFWMDFISNNWPVSVYDDATSAELYIDTSAFDQLVPNYDLDFELGTMGANGPADYAPLNVNPQIGQLFNKVVDTSTGKVVGIELNAVAIRQVYSDEDLAVKVDLKLDGYTITTSHLNIRLASTAASYWYYLGDSNEFPGNYFAVPDEIEYEIRNSQNPNGVSGKVDVTNVAVQVTSGNPDAVTVVTDGNMKMLSCNSLGSADVTITHKTPTGGTATYTYTINVVDSIWRSFYRNRDGIYNAVQGGSVTLDLFTTHERWTQSTGVYEANTPYELEWFTQNPSQAQYVTFVPNADKTACTLQLTANAPEEDIDFIYFVYELDANGNRIAGSVAECWGRLVVMNNFPYLKLDGFTYDLEVGETIVITPTSRNRYLNNGVVNDVPLANAQYILNYDPDSLEIIDNGDGTYNVTRLKSWEIESAYWRVEAPFVGDDFVTEEYLYFPKLNYEVAYTSLLGQNDTTWMYDNEDYTLEVDTTNLAGKRADVDLEWYVIKWIDDDNYDVLTEGYTVNGNKITLKGTELAAQGLEKFEVIAVVTSNGVETGDGAYVEVELRAHSHEAGVNLTKTEAVEATCENAGNIEYWTCDECGKIYSDETATTEISKAETVVAKKEHEAGKIVGKYDATCVETGYTGDVICSACSTVLETGSSVAATGVHNYLDKKCTMCNAEDTAIVPEEDVQLGVAGTQTEASVAKEAETVKEDILKSRTPDPSIYEVAFKDDVNLDEVAENISNGEVEIVVDVVAVPVEKEEVATGIIDEITTMLVAVERETAGNVKNGTVESGIAQYLDLSVLLKAQNKSTGKSETLGEYKKTENPITITITIPDKYLQSGYEVFILRNHEGVVEKIPLTANSDGIYSFTTNLFSTYALAYVNTQANTEEFVDMVCDHSWGEWQHFEGHIYKFHYCEKCGEYEAQYLDVVTPDNTVSNNTASANSVPLTGDTSNVLGWLALMMGCACILLCNVVYRKKK